MKGIILAAGKGSRISDKTDGLPKSFLKIGDKSIIEHQIESLRFAGIKDIVIVTGYLWPKFVEKFGSDPNITLLKNPFYFRCNVIGSLWFAREYFKEGFIFTHADTYFDREILTDLLKHKEKIVFAIEKKSVSVPEEMKVKIVGGVITEINKEMKCEDAFGEFIGVAKFESESTATIKKAVENRVEVMQKLDDYFEAAVQDIINQGSKVYACEIGSKFSIEIDFPEDYDRALKQHNERS